MKLGSIILDILIGSVVLFLGYVYWPFIQLYMPGGTENSIGKYAFSIEIPKINAYAPVVVDVDPNDVGAYSRALHNGVAKAKGFADFGENERIYMFAHAALPPWEMTRVNTSFLRLGELKAGDQILISKFGNKFIYKVEDLKEVWPAEVYGIQPNKENYLILQTSVPLGFDTKRLLVFAKFVKRESS